ncbi:MAG: FAD-dependent monooxygenase [Phycisphaerales bacterium]|nr:FAD-dependent monooxygenase [Phycisphaerales bacterium]
MTNERYDVVVIGAGVAGAAFAAGCAGSGRVLLVERSVWPRDKVCGCCLNAAALASLANLGLAEEVAASGAAMQCVRLRASGRAAGFARAGGVAVSRKVLDGLLVARGVARGVVFQAETAAIVVGPQPRGAGWLVELRHGGCDRIVEAGLVIAADGLTGGSLDRLEGFGPRVCGRSWFGVGGALEACAGGPAPGEVELCIGANGYVGRVRVDAMTTALAGALDPAWTKRIGGPRRALEAVLDEAGASTIDLGDVQIRGTGLLSRRRARVSAPDLLVLGDAAGYVEPFTGEGMAWAFAGAGAAVRMAESGMRGVDIAGAWSRWHAGEVRSRQRMCGVIRGVLRRPWLVGGAVALMGRVPAAAGLAELIARGLERPYAGGDWVPA